jgi:hypothetical protein
MKKITLLAILAIAAFSNNANAQSTANATASATIVTPIAISKALDMNFGNIATNSAVGTVVLTPINGRTSTGGVTFPAITGTVQAAKFTVKGEGVYTYALTLPADNTITISNGTPANDMKISTFTSNSTKKLTAGTETFGVGATLNLNASQPAGLYTNTTGFNVIVNYN